MENAGVGAGVGGKGGGNNCVENVEGREWGRRGRILGLCGGRRGLVEVGE